MRLLSNKTSTFVLIPCPFHKLLESVVYTLDLPSSPLTPPQSWPQHWISAAKVTQYSVSPDVVRWLHSGGWHCLLLCRVPPEPLALHCHQDLSSTCFSPHALFSVMLHCPPVHEGNAVEADLAPPPPQPTTMPAPLSFLHPSRDSLAHMRALRGLLPWPPQSSFLPLLSSNMPTQKTNSSCKT